MKALFGNFKIIKYDDPTAFVPPFLIVKKYF
jgi:hypothetical protein